MIPSSGAPSRLSLFNLQIDNLNFNEALGEIEKLVEGEGRHFVVTPNVDHVVRLHKNTDAEFGKAYERASLILADGMPLVWASRLLKKPLKGRIAGSDLVEPLCERAAAKGKTVYFLGGSPEAAGKAEDRLMRKYPALKIAGSYSPPFGFEFDSVENGKIVRNINSAKPDYLFVALGSPKQEKWISGHIDEMNIKVALCVGAALDFLSGQVHRAPRGVRRIGFEWLWRLVQEPRRLGKRYLVDDPLFFGILWNEFKKGR